jgi:peptide/nickel transport system permease protein
MLRFAGRRLAAAVVLVWLVATVTFALVALAPGDAASRLTDPRISAQTRERWRREFGLDRPWPARYAAWLGAAATGDLGTSWLHHRAVTAVLADALPNTALLAALGLMVEIAGGVAIALVQLQRARGRIDSALSFAALASYALPTFAVALALIGVFSYRLGLLPPSHMHSLAGEQAHGPARTLDLLLHLVLPAATIGLTGLGAVARYLRGVLLDERGRLYVLAARARGCSEQRALLVHVLPNALLPLITMIGMSLPFLVSGSLVVEVVFSWPGMGQLMFGAALARDVPLLMGATIVMTVAVVAGNLVADLAYAVVDPRVRL